MDLGVTERSRASQLSSSENGGWVSASPHSQARLLNMDFTSPLPRAHFVKVCILYYDANADIYVLVYMQICA